jgi:hypothetical protein
MNEEHYAKSASTKAGIFATLFVLLRAKGTGAPTSRSRAGLAVAAASLLALAAFCATTAPAALAAAPPTVTTNPAEEVGVTTAKLSGTVNPQGASGEPANTNWYIQYAPAGTEAWANANQATIAEPQSEEANPLTVEASFGFAGELQPGHQYEFRIFAEGPAGNAETPTPYPTFETQAATAPALTVNAPEPSYLKAHLSGTVDPEGGNVNPIGGPLPIAWQLQFSLASEPGNWQLAGAGTIEGPEAETSSPIEVPATAGDGTFSGPLTPGAAYVTRLVVTYAGSETAIAAEEPGFETLAVAKPSVSIEAVTTFSAHTAQLIGHVNPNAPKAKAETSEAEQEAFLTHYHFQCEPECPGLEGEVLAGKDPEEVPKEATGLIPGHNYEVSLIATNAGGTETAGPVEFTTEALPPQIDATFATAVSETEATLKAKVNPGGAETTVHFDYTTTDFSSCTPTGPECFTTPESASIGKDVEDHTAEATITNLQPHTAYRYRVIASNERAPSGTPGPTKGFTTTAAPTASSGCSNEQLRRENNSTALPDCRAYEQASPVDKGGFDATPRLNSGQLQAQASPSGEAVAYQGYGSLPGAKGSAFPNTRISTRSQGGWQTTDITPPTPQGSQGGIATADFAEDLSRFAFRVPLQILTDDAPPGAAEFNNLYTSDTGGNYSLVNSAAIDPSQVDACMGQPVFCPTSTNLVNFAGASRDFSHVLFVTNDGLQGTGAPPSGVVNLYENSGEQVQFLGILPDGEIASQGSGPGAANSMWFGPKAQANVNHAVSADGSRVIFSAASDEGVLPAEAGQNGMTQLYDRIEGQETIEISAPAPGAVPANPAPQPARYWDASDDGAQIFFTSAAELTTPSHTGAANNSSDLYRYNVDTETLTDLTVDTNPIDAETGAGVLGVTGTSTDGSYVYFVATGELLPGEGADGQPNLYVSHEGQLEFIATLGQGDSRNWTSLPGSKPSYATPDGHHFAFMSTGSLPTANFPEGYDNTDQITGAADNEVYEYSAPNGAEAGQLLCVSCHPSGARPTGAAFLGAKLGPLANSAFHQPRVISDSGHQVFFSSSDALAVGAGGPFVKVYEFERGGVGSCARQGGCLALISSAVSDTNDVFFDASADGRDVFFATADRLVPTDEDGLMDIYDARQNGGFTAPPTPPVCEGEEGCHGPNSTPPSGSAKATSTFAGPEEGPKRPRCRKGLVRRHGRCVSPRHHKRKHHRSHKRRANSNGRAGK